MFRLVVALYLMIVAAVGPAACCCTLTRLTTRLNEKPSTATEPASSSCCHHGPQKQTLPEAPERPSPGCPDAPGCPCKQAVGGDIVGLPAANEEAQEVSLRGSLAEFFCPSAALSSQFAPLADASPVFRERAALGPSVSTDDLLYAFHILRC